MLLFCDCVGYLFVWFSVLLAAGIAMYAMCVYWIFLFGVCSRGMSAVLVIDTGARLDHIGDVLERI